MSHDSDEANARVARTVLDLIDQQISANPDILVPLTQNLVNRLEALVAGVTVDLDEELPPDVLAIRNSCDPV